MELKRALRPSLYRYVKFDSDKLNSSACKESQFYSLPKGQAVKLTGQAVTNIY